MTNETTSTHTVADAGEAPVMADCKCGSQNVEVYRRRDDNRVDRMGQWFVKCHDCEFEVGGYIADILSIKAWNQSVCPAREPETVKSKDVIRRYENACKLVTALCARKGSKESREWEMSIPARPDHDPDLVIGASLDDIPKLLAETARLRQALALAEERVKEAKWLPINRENHSLRWLLMKDKDGVEGIRLGRPERNGWRIVDERGIGHWYSDSVDVYLAETPLNVPLNLARHLVGVEEQKTEDLGK